MMPPIMASISRKSSYKGSIIIFRRYIMGDEPIIIEQFFMGLRGLLWVWLWDVNILWIWLWDVNILWVRIMGVTLVMTSVLYTLFCTFSAGFSLIYFFQAIIISSLSTAIRHDE
jgi:hypothetical protein